MSNERDLTEEDLLQKMLVEASSMRDSEDWYRDNMLEEMDQVTDTLYVMQHNIAEHLLIKYDIEKGITIVDTRDNDDD